MTLITDLRKISAKVKKETAKQDALMDNRIKRKERKLQHETKIKVIPIIEPLFKEAAEKGLNYIVYDKEPGTYHSEPIWQRDARHKAMHEVSDHYARLGFSTDIVFSWQYGQCDKIRLQIRW